jgi:DNA-3-methyladenine glycosylase
MPTRLQKSYFQNPDTLFLAKDLIGKTLVRNFEGDSIFRSRIIETEAYMGSEDLACHASKGRTPRTEIMYAEGGVVYVYLIYGRYWLLNFVTGIKDHPHAILIRGIEDCSGPGRIGDLLQLDKSFYGEDLDRSNRIWLEDSTLPGEIIQTPRIGVENSGEVWRNKLLRFLAKN